MGRYKDFEKEVKFWIKELENYNEVPFAKQTPNTSWNMGQVYEHLFVYTQYVQKQIIEAIQVPAKEKGKRTLAGKVVFASGAFLGKKAKDARLVFDSEPAQPENIMEARNKMFRCLKLMDEANNLMDLHPDLAKTSHAYHPVLGELTAKQWFDLAIIHFKHHRKQKAKIDSHFMR